MVFVFLPIACATHEHAHRIHQTRKFRSHFVNRENQEFNDKTLDTTAQDENTEKPPHLDDSTDTHFNELKISDFSEIQDTDREH
jgi:hypothetical protein